MAYFMKLSRDMHQEIEQNNGKTRNGRQPNQYSNWVSSEYQSQSITAIQAFSVLGLHI
jgi:hypothetical protein